jgi:peptide/nickel transport system substrate-binding protein
VFLMMLAMPAASIVPAPDNGEGASDSGSSRSPQDKPPIGTGPYRLVDWQRDRRLVFARNESFWGSRPAFDRLVWQVITDDSARRMAFAQGQVDIFEVSFQEWDRYQNDPELARRLLPNQELRTDFVGFGCSRPTTGDVRVREALHLALDRESIFKNLQKSRGILATGPVPPLPGWESPEPVPHDPVRARKLLKEAGYSSERQLSINLWYRELALNGEIAAAIRKSWEAIGVQVLLTARDQAAFREAIWAGQPDAFIGSWTLDYPDPENALIPPFHSRNIPRQGNQAQIRDGRLDQMLEAAETATNPDLRRQLFQQAERYAQSLHPWIPLFHRRTYYDTSPQIEGWKPKLMYNADRFLDARPAARSSTHP